VAEELTMTATEARRRSKAFKGVRTYQSHLVREAEPGYGLAAGVGYVSRALVAGSVGLAIGMGHKAIARRSGAKS
jgi:hypothetical protein